MFSILIVDDKEMDREGIKSLIDWEQLGIEVAGLAGDGQEGYEMAMALKPDFVITDVEMPVMDGLEMTQKIRQDLPDTKFIFISCFNDFEYVRDAMKVDAFGYVLKPIELSELTQAIEKVKRVHENELERERVEEEHKKWLQASMPLLREQFFSDLIYGRLQDESLIRDQMEYLGITQPYSYYTVIFFQIDNYDLTYQGVSVEQKYILMKDVKKIIEETLLARLPGYVVNQQHDSVVVILLNVNNNDEELNNIIECLGECKSSINETLKVSMTIGIDEFEKQLTRMPRAFERAQYAVRSKFYSQGNRIILASEVRQPDSFLQYDLQKIKNQLTSILETGQEGDVVTFIEEYYPSGVKYPESYVKGLAFSIVNIVQTILIDKNESFKNIFDSDMVVWDKLGRFETIVDIKQWLVNVIEAVREYLARLEGSRYAKIVEDIKRIIKENYSQANINEIVKPLYISASYANRIFKEHTGKTIFDYLIDTRMEVAKQLLLDPTAKVYEVAEKVGYVNKSYFGSLFKEHTGLTPKQYMDKYAK